MDIKKLNLNNQKHFDEIFKKLDSLIYDPEKYGEIDGQLIYGKATYLFSNEAEVYWNSFLLQILQLKSLKNFVSIKTINKTLKPFLENFLIHKELDLDQINKAINELQHFKLKSNHYYFIIYGLTCPTIYTFSNISIGHFEQKDRTRNRSFHEKILCEFKEISAIKMRDGTYTEDDMCATEVIKTIDNYKNNFIIEITNLGDTEISKAQSLKDAEHFVNELIFLSSLLPINLNFNINLGTNENNSYIKEPLHIDYSQKSILNPPRIINYSVVFDLSESAKKYDNIGFLFKELNFPLLSKYEDLDLINKLQIAISWYASSLKSNNNRESFLFCAIGMESLLSYGRDSITKTLAENTAFLIAKKDKESRKFIYSKITHLYAQRSGIAHGGNTNIELQDLKQLRSYLAICIITIIKKIQKDEINTTQDLTQYLEDQKFS